MSMVFCLSIHKFFKAVQPHPTPWFVEWKLLITHTENLSVSSVKTSQTYGMGMYMCHAKTAGLNNTLPYQRIIWKFQFNSAQ